MHIDPKRHHPAPARSAELERDVRVFLQRRCSGETVTDFPPRPLGDQEPMDWLAYLSAQAEAESPAPASLPAQAPAKPRARTAPTVVVVADRPAPRAQVEPASSAPPAPTTASRLDATDRMPANTQAVGAWTLTPGAPDWARMGGVAGVPGAGFSPQWAGALPPDEQAPDMGLATRPGGPERAYLGGGRWVALIGLCTLAAAAVGVAALGRIEVVSEAEGSLLARGGPRPVAVLADGVIAELSARPGQQVEAGQLLAHIAINGLEAALERSAQEVALLREQAERTETEAKAQLDAALTGLVAKGQLLQRRAALKSGRVAKLRKHAEHMRALSDDRVALESDALAAEQAAFMAREELLLLRQQVAEVQIEVADRKRNYEIDRTAREFRTREAEAALTEARTRTELGRVHAPEAGRLESLLVSEGEAVRAGQVVAQIVPEGSADRVVVFAPEKDAPFLRPGLPATLEFASLPVSEFGRAKAKITRVAKDRPLPAELARVLGTRAEQRETLVRVEVEPVDDATWKKMSARLDSGAQVVAHLQTRKRRIASLLFDFIR